MTVCDGCRAESPAGTAVCTRCGHTLRAPLFLRRGSRFAVRRGAALPPFCVQCGARTGGLCRIATFTPKDIAADVISILDAVHLVVHLFTRPTFRLAIPVCEAHWRGRRGARTVGFALVGGAVVLSAWGAILSDELLRGLCFWAAAPAVIASAFVFRGADEGLSLTQIDADWGEFDGAHEKFLFQLP